MIFMVKKCGCDMRGMLSFQILWLLNKRSMHGEKLACEIEKRRGQKPKASTIYPALRELREQGFISGKKKGKIITYSLTQPGRRAAATARAYFIRSFRDILEEH